jgi:hypothetical protein
MFKFLKKKSVDLAQATWQRVWSKEGVIITKATKASGHGLDSPSLVGYLEQLIDDGLATEQSEEVFLAWDALYAALERPAYRELAEVLRLPPFTSARPSLRSNGALTDQEFSISIGGWRKDGQASFDGDLLGPLLLDGPDGEFMPPKQWELFSAVVGFARRPASERTDVAQRAAWGRIRRLAVDADARLDDFLLRTVVLTPERLTIGLRKSTVVADDKVVEVTPGFADEPDGWLAAFDRNREVRERYDLVTPEGVVQILITPQVSTVLREIKRLENRRVAGSRAQAFLSNPFATLGPDATEVIDEAQFERARDEAGLHYERFVPVIERDATGHPERAGLLIEAADSTGLVSSETRWFDGPDLDDFIDALQRGLEASFHLLGWEGYEFELDGDAARHLEALRDVSGVWQRPAALVSYLQVHDLNAYSARIEGIGVEAPYVSPYIAKKNEGDPWFPENIVPLVVYRGQDGGEPIAVPTTRQAIERLKADLDVATTAGRTELTAKWLPQSISVDEARRVVDTFSKIFEEVEATGTFDPGGTSGRSGTARAAAPKQLILRSNIHKVEYEELCREALEAVPPTPRVPSSIAAPYGLLKHQLAGLAWLQHLYSLQTEYQVRGAILADDMGLGKTFQLLSLMAGLLERGCQIAPMLVVAPVSLLENWTEEANKFFVPGTFNILTAYGDALSALRVPREQIDRRLQEEDKLVKFLRPDWVGDATLVLTTYETLRDFEFSFASQKWSLMVCDEAQRIKNPAAMVTRAAKKQNVDFKIACTGTPVENTLADLWCLFDYVQPGLLGALDDFGTRYRRPIEAKTEEERARVEELRSRIAPRILRRLKTDVIDTLPPKIVVEVCRRLPLSVTQRNLYAKAVESFKRRDEPDFASPFKNHLGLLHYLRLVCTDPRPHGLSVFKPEPADEYRRKAPKLDWLLSTLTQIRSKGEKAIVFCEFREIQRLLQHYIELEFGFRPDIINGDSAAAASHSASRQKRIKAFQQRDGFGVIILSPVAVGFGVNIQRANHVIHYTRTWNPAKEDQATDRAYRIGQEKSVYVYYPVVHAEDFTTFDVKLDQLLTFKRKLAEDMLNGAGDVAPGDFVMTDVIPDGETAGIDERITLDMALRMGGQHFECLIGVLWAKQGYETYRTPSTKDYGVDVVAISGDHGQLVQAKSSAKDGATLGWDAVKEVVAGEAYYRRRHSGIRFERVCITNQFFNGHATENASLNAVQLLDQEDLARLLDIYPVTLLEVERMLYSDWQ